MPGRIPDPRMWDPALHEAVRSAVDGTDEQTRPDDRAQAGTGSPTPDYASWSVEELRHRAAELGIAGRSSMDEGELVAALRHAARQDAAGRDPARRDD